MEHRPKEKRDLEGLFDFQGSPPPSSRIPACRKSSKGRTHALLTGNFWHNSTIKRKHKRWQKTYANIACWWEEENDCFLPFLSHGLFFYSFLSFSLNNLLLISSNAPFFIIFYPSVLLKRESERVVWQSSTVYQCENTTAPHYKSNMDILEQVHWGDMKTIKGLQHPLYKERLRELGLLSLEKRRLERNLPILINIWW